MRITAIVAAVFTIAALAGLAAGRLTGRLLPNSWCGVLLFDREDIGE